MPESNNFKCLVFGGSGLLGSEICRVTGLPRWPDKAKIVFTYCNNKNIATSLRDVLAGSTAMACDFLDARQIKKTVTEAVQILGGLDAVIVAVGTQSDGQAKLIQDISEESFDEQMRIHSRGTLFACQAAVGALKEAGGGNIVIIGSPHGIKAIPGAAHFASAKAALRGLVETLSKELGEFNIRINLIAPGIIDGSEQGHSVSARMRDELKESYLKHCGLGRFAKACEIAEVAAWFARRNTYITGQCILLDGGL